MSVTYSRTLQATRQALFAALTTPALQYQIDMGSVITLPIGSLVPKSVWLAGGVNAPDPLVSFNVSAKAGPSRTIDHRLITLSVWCVAKSGPDEVTGLYEAVRARLHRAEDAIGRPATASYLAITLQQIVEVRASEPDFELETQRWYCRSEFSIVAV